jgi:hypothetical protein
LVEDAEVVKYRRLCKQTKAAISSSVWRERFVRTFDMPPGEPGTVTLSKRYAYRRRVCGWCCFDYKKTGGYRTREEKAIQQENNNLCLGILKELILGKFIRELPASLTNIGTESNASRVTHADGKEVVVGLNHDYIVKWIEPGASIYTVF